MEAQSNIFHSDFVALVDEKERENYISNAFMSHRFDDVKSILDELTENERIFSLNKACMYGDTGIIDCLHERYNAVEDADKALRLSCYYGHSNLADYFISNYWIKDINQALEGACSGGHANLVDYLCVHYSLIDNADDTALKCASQHGHIHIVEYLISHEINTNEGNIDKAFLEACYCGHVELVKYLMKYNPTDINSSFYVASINNHINVVKFLLPFVSVKSISRVFIDAYTNGRYEIASFLVSKGVVRFNKDFVSYNMITSEQE